MSEWSQPFVPLPFAVVRATHILAAFFGSVAASLAVTEPAADPDLFWHLASGAWMLEHGRLLDHDVFSFTRSGEPYSVGQWLGQLALASAFRAGGWQGVEVLRATLIAVATLFLSRAVLRVQPHPGWAALPIVAAVLISRLAWGDRPQLFTIALFPVFFDLLLRARLDERARTLALLPPLALLWANLHGAFPLGLALLLAFTVEGHAVRHSLRWRFTATLVACAIATQVNPTATRALGWAVSYASAPGRHVVEERPTDLLAPAGIVFGAMLLGALGASLVLGRHRIAARVGPPLLWTGLIVPFALLGIAIQRQLPYAAYVLAPFVGAAIPAALGRARTAAPHVPGPVASAIVGVLIAVPLATAALAAPAEPDLRAYPVAAVRELRPMRGPLLNEYDWGGYLIYAAPEHPVFIDGRGAALFVPGVLDDWVRAVEVRPGYAEILERHDIRLVLLRPHRPLVAALREGGWHLAAEEGDRWVLLVRP